MVRFATQPGLTPLPPPLPLLLLLLLSSVGQAWRPPPQPAPCVAADRRALLAIRSTALQPPLPPAQANASILANWTEDGSVDPCLGPWRGVACNRAGRVTLLSLCCGLRVLSGELGVLDALAHLILDDNALEALPESITRLPALQLLDLGGNRLGSLPDGMGRLPRLRHMLLDGDWLLPQAPAPPDTGAPSGISGTCAPPNTCCLGWTCAVDSALSAASLRRRPTGNVWTPAVGGSLAQPEACLHPNASGGCGGSGVALGAGAATRQACEQSVGCTYQPATNASSAAGSSCSNGGDASSAAACEYHAKPARTRCTRVREACWEPPL
jgi:hypothetical protein